LAVAEAAGIDGFEDPDGRRLFATISLLVALSAVSFAGSVRTFSFVVNGVPSFSLSSAVAFCSSCKPASGRAICEEIMAGSTGAPATVGLPVGRRRAGGMYLFGWLDCRGGYSFP